MNITPVTAMPTVMRAPLTQPPSTHPFVEPGIYSSGVTRHHPPMPISRPHLGSHVPVIVVHADQSRSYEYYRSPVWNAPASFPRYPAHVD